MPHRRRSRRTTGMRRWTGATDRCTAEQQPTHQAGDGSPRMLLPCRRAGQTQRLWGVFGTPVTWPIIGLHAVLLPDGRVMSYGTDEQGQQGAQFVYDVWTPTL